jgi:hypothetical protein
MPLDYNEFANKIKAKYPQYKNVDNYELATKMVAKYPQYKDQVDLKKKEVSVSQSGAQGTSSGRLSSTTTKPTGSSRRFEGATVEPISQKKYRTDDYIDQVQNAKTQPKQTKTVVANTFVPNAKEQKVDVITTDEANQMMAEDFGKKEFELYSQISEIDPNVFKEGEESAVKYLNDKFKGSGFVFEETGLGNSVRVKSTLDDGFGTTINEKVIELPNKTWTTFGLVDTKTGEETQKEVSDFMNKAFLKKSEKEFLNEDVKDYGQLVKLAADNPYKYGEGFLNQYDTERWMDGQYRDLVIAGKNIKREQETLQREIDAYKESGVYNEETERLIRTRAANLQNQVQANTSKYEELQDISAKLPKAAAVYMQNKEKEGNFAGLVTRNLASGLMNIEKALITTATDVAPLLIPSKYMIPEVEQVRLKASGMTDSQIKDYAAKQLRKGVVNEALEGAKDLYSLGTTEAYAQSKDRNDIEKTASFLAESIGTAISGGANPLLSKIAFFSQSYNAIEDEMNSPQFDGMSQMEKKIMSVPYGIVIGQLDRLGFNVATKIGSNPVLNKLITNTIASAFTSLPKNASIDVMQKAIGESLKATMAKTGLEIVGGSLVEGLTEGTQSLAEYTMKNLYNNVVANQELFQDVPDITTKEGFDKALAAAKEETYYGALGGLIMASGSTALKSLSKGFDKGAEEFDFFSKVINDPKLRALIETDIKTKITSGEITKAEAQEQLDAINKSVSILNKMPENLPSESKMEAYNLILEKNKIEKEIAGKDSALVAAQTERVAEINEQLKQLSKDAVQKQSTNEVPVQPGAAVGQQVEERVPESETEGTTGETVREEAQWEQAETALTEEERQGVIDNFIESEREAINNLSDSFTQEEKQGIIDELESDPIEYAKSRAGIGVSAINNFLGELGIQRVEQEAQQQVQTTLTEEERQSVIDNFVKSEREAIEDAYGDKEVWKERKIELLNELESDPIAFAQSRADIESSSAQFVNQLGLNKEAEQATPTTTEEATIEEVKPTETKIEDIEVDETPMADDLMDEVTKLKNLTTKQDFTNVDIKNPGRRKVVAQAAKAAKAISKVLPKVKIVLHSKSEDYVNATKEMGGRLSEGGLYNNKRKEIHINLEKANNRTVAHEVFHALLISRVKSDADAQKLTKSMIDSVIKSLLVTEKGGAKVLSYLQEFSNRYEDNVKNEEKLAELFSILADNYKTLPEPSRNIIRRFLDRLASLFGIKKMTDNDVIQFMNTLSRKVEEGVEIEQYEVGKIQNAKDINTRFQANFSDAVSKLTFEYDKNNERFEKLEKEGYITRDKSIDDFAGKFMLLHQPDAAFSGSIYKDGELLVEGKGGVFYPIKFHNDGYFWASTSKTAKKMADDLNKVMDQNGGTIYMALTSAPYDKLMSSTTMSNAILDFFSSKAFDSNFKITPAQLNIALRKAANDVKVVNNKKIGLGLGLASDASLNDVKSKIKEALNADNSSFADRKNFAEELIKIMADKIKNDPKATQQFGELFSEGIQNKYFKGKTKTGKLKISPANMVQAISEMFTEPILKEGVDREKGGQVYAVVELSGKVKPTESTKHESYPMAIQADSDSKVKIHLLKDRKKWNEVFLDPDTNEAVDKAREKKIFPTTGVSTKGLQVGGFDEGDFATRKQKLSDVDQIVDTAKKNNISDEAIRKLAKDQGFSDREVSDALQDYSNKAEGIFIKSEDGGVKTVITDFARKYRQKYLSSKGFLPKIGFTYKERMEQQIAKEANQADKVARKFSRMFHSYKGDKDALISDFDKYLRGDTSVKLPEGFGRIADQMRAHIDKLSQDLIASGMVGESSIEDIIKNMDSYLNKEIDKKANQETINKAKDFLKNQQNFMDKASEQSKKRGIPLDEVIEKIASVIVEDSDIEVIINNMGSYLTRSYEIYDNRNWKQKVTQETIDKAKNFLKNQPGFMDMAVEQSAKEGIPLDEVLQTMVDNKIEEWLSKDNAKALISGSKLGSKDLSILKQKQDIPEELRMLMGEYTDPAMNYARTILKISNLTAKHKFLVDMKKAGLNKFFFEENNPRKPLAFNTKLAAEGSETMNPLNGLYTTPEIAEAFGGFMSPNSEISKLLEYYYKAMVGVKWAKTIGSFATHMKNVIGNLGFVALNGHNLRELGNSYKVLKADFIGSDDATLQKKINEYIELGVIKQGAGINEIKDMFKDARIDTFLEQRISSKTPKTKAERLSNLTKKKAIQLKVFLEELYQAEDDMYKIVAFETEMNRYSKALYGKSKSQLTEDQRKRVSEKASEVIKNLYPSYNRIPEAIKKMRRVPLFFGSFISFQAESLRTSYKTFELIKEELNSENPEIKKIGAKRLAYATAYLSMKTAALSLAGMAAGTGMSGVLGALFDDDDEKEKEKDVREFVAPWSKDSDLIILKAGDGTIDYIDFSASDPHGSLNRAMNAFLKGDNAIDAFSDGVVALISPFLGGDITTTALLNLKNNTNQYGGQIYNPEDDFEDQSTDILEHIYKLVEPGTITTVRRIIESDNKLNEIAGTTGFKVQSVDLAKQFGFKTKEFSERLNDTKRPYNTEYYKTVEIIADPRSSKEGRQEQIDKTELEYEKSNKKYNQVADEFKEVFNSALRLGTDYDLLETIIMDGRTFSKKNLYDWEDGFKLEIPYKEY